MKTKDSKQFYSNKSGIMEKKGSNLVIRTQLQNSFDNRWAQIKIQGKNISSRSNHATVVFGNSLFIHGGYDVDHGIIGDFYEMDLSQDCQQYLWKKVNNSCDGKQIKLKSHTAVTYRERILLFGGQKATTISSNTIYAFDLVTSKWKSIPSQPNIPKLDSHCATVIDNKMYVYGGYISDKAQYLIDILAYDIQNNTWQVTYKGLKNSQDQPVGRANFSMIECNGDLLIFGGSDGNKTLNDMWNFNLKQKKWNKIQSKDSPQARRGHSMIKYQKFIFVFGGIQDVTKEKNDIYIFQLEKQQWSKIHTTTNSVYDCSPTLKKSQKVTSFINKRNKSPQISPKKISPNKQERSEDPMKKILNENKQKKFLQRKKELLKQFSDNNVDSQSKRKRDLSPTTQSMLKTLQTIGNQQINNIELKQEIVYDDTHRYIIGKKPCARDGQSVNIYNNKMYIFGGDRHLMAFNDLYQFDLAKGIKSLEIYKSN